MVSNRVSPTELRWRCPGQAISATGDVADPWDRVRRALLARLEHALDVHDWRHAHVFVRGPATTVRGTLVESALKQLTPRDRPACDHCFVHNFDDPNRPLLVRLPAGQGTKLRAALGQIGRFIRDELDAALNARPIRNRLRAIEDRVAAEMDRLAAPIESRLKPHGLVLVRVESGQIVRLTIHVQQTGRVITQDDFANLVAKGQVSRDEFNEIRKLVRELQPELGALTTAINESWSRARELRARVLNAETRRLILNLAEPLLQSFDRKFVARYVEAMINDVLETRVDRPAPPATDPERLYGANVIAQADADALHAVHEPVPSRRNLAGTIEPVSPEPFQGIRAGSLIAAGHGFLIVDAEDLLARPRSVDLLRNALYHRSLVIQGRSSGAAPMVSLRPDPVPIDCRLLVVGTPTQWERLARRHAAFSELFAAPLDVPATLERDRSAIGWLAEEFRRAALEEQLVRPDTDALRALVEIAARRGGAGRLRADPAALMPLLRRAAAIAAEESADTVAVEHIERAAARIDPSRSVQTRAFHFPARQEQTGRVHGCLVTRRGSHCQAALVQCQASVAPATGFSVEFDGIPNGDAARRTAARLSVLLARALRLDRPLGLRVVVDVVGAPRGYSPSADDALMLIAGVALASELSAAPLRQNIALLGRLHADGRVGAIDCLNECVEAAWHASSSERGDPVLIIPAAQREALMLDPELVQAAANDLFQLVGAGSFDQILESLTGAAPGAWRNNAFAEDSLYGRARARLRQPDAG